MQDQKRETQRQVQALMRLAGELYEQRGYAGTITVEWMVGVYTQTSALHFERYATTKPPWGSEEDYIIDDVLEKDSTRLGTSLRQLVKLLEDRALTWTEDDYFLLGHHRVPDELTGIPASRDPLLGATGTIGLSFFGIIGLSVSISATVYASRLRRWRQRVDMAWPLAGDIPRWRPVYDDLGGPVTGAALKAALNGIGLGALTTSHLTHCWHLADVSKDGLLDLDEFVLFMHLATWAQSSSLPPELPLQLVPPRQRRRKTTTTDEEPTVTV